jgi:hypothetical protein
LKTVPQEKGGKEKLRIRESESQTLDGVRN